jgi:methyl-accepting chemotaxis protein
MIWRNLSLGGKLTVAFGSISLILAVVAIWAITGIGNIVNDAGQVIDGNKFRANLQEKYNQHLKWTDKLSSLVYDVNVTEVELQTDPHKCAFGQWYYGNGLNEVKNLAPELLPTIQEMEQPHIHLHGSAVKILDVYHHADYNLSILMQSVRGDHLAWTSAVQNAVMNGNSKLEVQMDPTKCNMGKWIATRNSNQAITSDRILSEMVNNIISDHEALHYSAKDVDKFLKRRDVPNARRVFNESTNRLLEKNIANLNSIIEYNNNNLSGIRKSEEILHTETQPNLQILATLFNKAIEDSEGYIMTDQVMLQQASKTRSVVAILAVISIVIAIILTIVITRALVKPIKSAVGFAQQIAEGNLMVNVSCSTNDEMGQLCNALSNMAGRLSNIVREIIDGADNITAASMEMSSTSQTVSQGASEQASSTEEVSTSMEEMTANIQQNTDNSKQTETIASKAVISIKVGSESTNIAVSSMKEIAEKIQIINDIAFQTNILALNAAVEAARAGEHGKGFAVVAAEVRKLAERSKIAADEINQLSTSGVKISEKAGIQLAELVPEIEKTSNLVLEITASSNEQNSGADQINNAIQQLSQVTQQNAAASEELASQAEQLKDLISYFKVDGKSRGSLSAKKEAKSYINKTSTKFNKPQPTTAPGSKGKGKPGNSGDGVVISFDENIKDDEYVEFKN